MTKIRVTTSALVIGLALLGSGCASNDDVDIETYVNQIEPADQLFNQGLANLNSGRAAEAAKKFAAVDRQHPYSEYARRSIVLGAFANYRQGRYVEAISASKRFLTLYPTDKEAAYAQYIIGLSYWRQIPDVTRDQADSRRTIAAMSEVVERYPESEYVDDAKNKIRFARDQLAGKEMQTGRYYLERKEFLPSIKRFRIVVEEYSNTRHIEEALARLVEAYFAMGLTSEAQTAAAVLGNNFPDSEWYKDSYKLLQSGGLQPRESGSSWLTNAAKSLTGA
ncbi:MAG: outer membrane protein assembly factor BamD [Rhizobiaceae bacterium]